MLEFTVQGCSKIPQFIPLQNSRCLFWTFSELQGFNLAPDDDSHTGLMEVIYRTQGFQFPLQHVLTLSRVRRWPVCIWKQVYLKPLRPNNSQIRVHRPFTVYPPCTQLTFTRVVPCGWQTPLLLYISMQFEDNVLPKFFQC